ncbi:RNA-binding, RBD [Glarea lozoyensis ATCC 20868]|uniref:RNA-binding, RBD n=1 Tax=Glarea lozoyensis (strain ATCC 20868 / MF5171) TaxID=1116229 RepID=S3DYC8_GLAL2|nr:RNA-binding, RBD [Glarea lozoyensis ATCC 20868]EPE36936.1 RNA-binding, RBD [Glarea lozoyensis ATCC 20868]
MNSIRQIQELNKRELENGVSPEASWHADYRDTAYIYIGGLPFELSEGDIITIFSQFGEPVYINLIRDKETGKSKGFAFLKYEDQRSTDLAVDNLGGSVIMGRTLKVDHTRYKKKDDAPDEGIDLTAIENEEGGGEGPRKRRKTDESESEGERPMIKEERELAKLIQEHDDDDPMKAFLIEDKKEEIKLALARVKGEKSGNYSESRSKHRHHHKSRREKDDRRDGDEGRSRHRRDGHKSSRRSRSRDNSPPRNKERRERSSRDQHIKRDDSMPRRRKSPSPGDERDYDRRRSHNDRRRRSQSRT